MSQEITEEPPAPSPTKHATRRWRQATSASRATNRRSPPAAPLQHLDRADDHRRLSLLKTPQSHQRHRRGRHRRHGEELGSLVRRRASASASLARGHAVGEARRPPPATPSDVPSSNRTRWQATANTAASSGPSESTVAAPTPVSPRLPAGHRDHTIAEENGNAEEKAKPTYS